MNIAKLEEELSQNDGELQRARARHKELREDYGLSDEEMRAAGNLETFTTQMNSTNHTPFTRVPDEEEYIRLAKLAESAKKKRELHNEKVEIARQESENLETELLKNFKRIEHLQNDIKPGTDSGVAHNLNRISQKRYEIDRDTNYLLNQIGEFDAQIETLEAKLKEKPKKILGKSPTADAVKIEIEINGLKIKRQNILNQYPKHQEWCNAVEAEILALERSNKIQQTYYDDAINETKGEIVRISGITVEGI
jgi:predicted nuclease with TOPRIM domain